MILKTSCVHSSLHACSQQLAVRSAVVDDATLQWATWSTEHREGEHLSSLVHFSIASPFILSNGGRYFIFEMAFFAMGGYAIGEFGAPRVIATLVLIETQKTTPLSSCTISRYIMRYQRHSSADITRFVADFAAGKLTRDDAPPLPRRRSSDEL